jgi:mono/diheme cytochrome c family protein
MPNASYAIAIFLLALDTAAPIEQSRSAGVQDAAPRDNASAAFEAIVPVLRHPRCMNCHSAGDFPRQGNDSHPHTMQIRRGPDGHGINSVQCSTCHQDRNLAGLHMPPGAPDWHLPPPETPMIWERLTDGQLCELLKDPRQNGHRDIQQIVEHMATPLVLWGWNPGEGRTPIPMKLSEFQAHVRDWAAHGATCPIETGAVGNSEH